MLRLYLPFRDPTLEDGKDVVRWSRYVAVEDHAASLDWFEATAGIAEEQPSVRGLVSWMGYAEAPHTSSPKRVFGEEYFKARLSPDDVRAGRRLPAFTWDSEGRLAWGGRLYPDSLIVAAELPIFRQLFNDPRIDTVSVRADRDNLPQARAIDGLPLTGPLDIADHKGFLYRAPH